MVLNEKINWLPTSERVCRAGRAPTITRFVAVSVLVPPGPTAASETEKVPGLA